ncbi:MAG: phosphocholine cytidylyltransferase family protein [Spirochaetes bacterium]|nr:phosphocholine cytidylyltransferase family protein [Spirochaetota bacterium]
MDGLILAAGMATRLKPLTDDTPKSLLPVAGKPILQYIIDNLISHNIPRIVMVTGFLEEKIKDFLKTTYSQTEFVFITNKDYSTTNNAYSLLLAGEEMKNDFILLDSDILFNRDIISLILQDREKIMLAVKRHHLAAEEIKVIMEEDHRIKKIGKEVPVSSAFGESVGIEYFPKEYVPALFQTLQKRIIKENHINEFYEASFQEMIDSGFHYYGVDIGELEAIEIDFKEDLEKAGKIVRRFSSE